ncbi:MAG: C2 family cysteine protease [Planctomycetota bacterium]|nr:C2 family cysteine protease [Planctomycetota bacterium]
MSIRSTRSNPKNGKRKTTKLGIEQLESRLMNSIDTLESGLQLLNAPGLFGATQIVSNGATSNSGSMHATPPDTNTPPTVASTLKLTSGTSVVGRTAILSVLGADNAGETQLRYIWSVASAPTGGTVTFALNRSNAAKTNTLTFNKSGSYQVMVTIVDSQGLTSTSSLEVRVDQTLNALVVKTTDGKSIAPGGTLNSIDLKRTFNVQGLDQFGFAMKTQPDVNWQTVSTPSQGSATLTQDSGTMTVAFNRAGAYGLRVQSGSVRTNFSVNVMQSLTFFDFATTSGVAIDPVQAVRVSTKSQQLVVRGFDQFGDSITTLPGVSWSTVSAPTNGLANVGMISRVSTITFNRAGSYMLSAKIGKITQNISFEVASVLTSVAAYTADNKQVGANTTVSVYGRDLKLTSHNFDQFGLLIANEQPLEWTGVFSSSKATASVTSKETLATFSFQRAGRYTFRLSVGAVSQSISINVMQTISSLTVTPGTSTLKTNAVQQFRYQVADQFGDSLVNQPVATWTTNGGIITALGVLNAGARAGSFTVTARVGNVLGTASVEVTDPAPTPTPTPTPSPTPTPNPTPQNQLRNAAISNLVSTLYADSQLTRAEVIQVLRSAGTDGIVDQSELEDLRYISSSTSVYAMPVYVRELAKDVVNSNPANRSFKGQTAGDLRVGSTSTLLNNLVDKWFLGADEPVLKGSGLSYQTVVGNLFNATPSRSDAKQGQLGDCYFIAAISAIADKNPDAVRNLFIDNGDGTYSVRYYDAAMKADYVTVNRRLPAYSNGQLAYSGYGQSITSTATTLWIALAEKAYAQWNETGNEGRDGTNRYSAIEGGWMSYVNAQVLGYNSTNYAFATSQKQTLVSAITSGKSITLGTITGAKDGFYGGHAYIVTGYNATTDTFSAYNPWGNSHPGPLTWAQLQSNCSAFTVTDPSGSTAINLSNVKNSMSETFIGNWTTVIAVQTEMSSDENLSIEKADSAEPILAILVSLFTETADTASDITFDHSQAFTQESQSANELSTTPLAANLVDLAMSELSMV